MLNRIEKIYILFFLGAISLLLATLFSVVFFYGLALILLLGFTLLMVYSTMEYIISREPDDLWKIGFIGLFGLIGLIPFFSMGFFGFFGFFAYFGLKS
ncbi:MAG: hypothetical protein PHI91_01905 [Candidatus Pacebacteria bacterium]|nr:hypothetical protein [Candidatus Paceibacterota bacterium]MDD2757194.1 hypothetical protein [Candidatus Paceibacterota bacterium]MDD3283765.1 hypothetical protein [Candidatus Paceibacterota bacterium]MDD3969926.1 hypothetical protein [Candidatus Paceibacterota bacterium]MDD4737817.1 hypothetical protein [Candidatus Paceibacterota bacterium]